ncbi:hypothetical protein BDR05DRAFT_966986 [Suillus weaverae]|nr:hypothetical protein BDR05DRAFT_966986 [Suillus weaverae]
MATSLIRVGQVVLHIPKRSILASSSGSWMEKPADKFRPCVIVSHNAENDTFALAPLCGAEHTTAGWKRRDKMVPEWWHPVEFANGNIEIPPDSFQRKPIILTHHDPLVTGLPTKSNLKPCYIWAGDAGEYLSIDAVKGLRQVDHLSIDQEQLKRLVEEWDHWNANHRPTLP